MLFGFLLQQLLWGLEEDCWMVSFRRVIMVPFKIDKVDYKIIMNG
jgi:hypothetical protein